MSLLSRAALSAVLSFSGPAFVLAKPADLPVDILVNFAENTEPVAQQPTLVPVDRTGTRPVNTLQVIPINEHQAQEIFQRAETAHRQGHLAQARSGFQEVHLLVPTTRLGQQAMQRLREIEAPAGDFSEEQEPPLLRTSYRPTLEPRRQAEPAKPTLEQYLDMLRLTQPLGLVPSGTDPF